MSNRIQFAIFFIILFTSYCTQPSFAAWSEGAWPAKDNSPRKDVGGELARDIWVMNCYSAICEIADLVWTKYDWRVGGIDYVQHPDAPRFYRSTRAELVNMKNWITNHSKYFVDWTEMGTNADFNVWMGDNAQVIWDPTTYTYYTNFPMEFPTFSNLSHLASASGVPANFFTVSFWRDINGYAGLSDDSIVAGYGREDYGFDGLRRVITNLSMVQVNVRSIPASYMYGWGEFDLDSWYTNHSEPPSCADIVSEAKQQAMSNVETQEWVFTGFSAFIDPVSGWADWAAGTETYEVFHNFGQNTNPPAYTNLKFRLYVAHGENVQLYAYNALPQFAETIAAAPGATNGLSANAYGATGFREWPDADCTNYAATMYESDGYGPPISYVEFLDLKYK